MRFDTIIAFFLILIGLVCLTMSGTFLFGSNVESFVSTFFQICVWMLLPLFTVGIILFLLKRRKGD